MHKQGKKAGGLLALPAGFAAGAALAAAALAGFAAWYAAGALPRTALWPMATAAVCTGALLSGYWPARRQAMRGLLCGLAEGGAFCLLLALAQLLYGGYFAPAQLARMLLVLLCGCLGGLYGAAHAAGRRRHK